MNRTDGALVRLTTQIYDGETEYDADRRLQAFMRDAVPTLSQYLPSEVTSQVKSVRFGPKDIHLGNAYAAVVQMAILQNASCLLGLGVLGFFGVTVFWFSAR